MKTLIVIYRSFNVGGIETNMADIMENALEKGRRVIWLGDRKLSYSPTYSNVMENRNLEKICIDFSSLNALSIPALKLDVDEEVCITVFDIKSVYVAYKLREKHRDTKIKIFYLVPLFSGPSIFMEESFSGLWRKMAGSFCRKLYIRLNRHGNLHFFSKIFYEAIESAYNIKLEDPDKFCVPDVKKRIPFDPDTVSRNYSSETFTIISAGRFEFPHKGFVLGLVESFSAIHKRYPNTKLIIIGDGPDKDRLIDKIQQQPEKVQESIEVLPPVTQDRLIELMKRCNLNISVAGCASLGAKVGVPTLPARHFHEKCEVYGFFLGRRGMTTLRVPGKAVEPFIEKTINMSRNEYMQLAYDTYHCFDGNKTNLEYPFDFECDTEFVPSRSEYLRFKLLYLMQRIKYQLSKFHS